VQGADLPGSAPTAQAMQQVEKDMHIQQPGSAQDVMAQGKEWQQDVTSRANANLQNVNQEYIAARRKELENSLKYQAVSTKFTDKTSGIIERAAHVMKNWGSLFMDSLANARDLGDTIRDNFYKSVNGKAYSSADVNKISLDTNDMLKLAQTLQYVDGGSSKMKELFEKTGMDQVLTNSDTLNTMRDTFKQYALDHGADERLADAYADAKTMAIADAARFAGITGVKFNRPIASTNDKLIDQAVLKSAYSGHDSYLHRAIEIRRAEQHVPEMPSSGGITGPKWYDSQNPKPRSVSPQEMALREKLLNSQSKPTQKSKPLGPDA
jgi:hypothetical protein